MAQGMEADDLKTIVQGVPGIILKLTRATIVHILATIVSGASSDLCH